MVYKKYMYREGKRFGPYYFKSVRNKDGSVSSIYLGKKKPESNSLRVLSIILLALCLVSLLGYFSYNAFIVSDVPSDGSSSEGSEASQDATPSESSESESSSEQVSPIQESEQEIIDETSESEINTEELPIDRPAGDRPSNDSDDNEDLPINSSDDEIPINNASEINRTNELPINDSEIDVNETEELPINNSEVPVNFSDIINFTDNLTPENTTDINISINNTFNFTNVSINETINFTNISINETLNFTNETINFTNMSFSVTEKHYSVIINQPVKWEKIISASEEINNLEVEIPENASNITVYEIIDGEEIQIDIDAETENLITGGAIFDIKKIGFNIWNFIKNIFGFTGLAVFDEENITENNTFIIDVPVTDVKVEYYMPGPIAQETQINDWTKQIYIENFEAYPEVLVYTNLDETSGGVSIVDSAGNKIESSLKDLNLDGNYDYVEWLTDAENETFNISIVVLNFQSFPVVGEEWIVYFNTTGIADLKVTPINGTQWSFDGNNGDLMFWNFTCGDKTLDSYYENGSYIVPNYNCSETGSEISHVITSGGHYLEFDFGGQKAYAKNAASCGSTITASEVLTGSLLNCAGSGITIGANVTDPITLDCAGFTIDGTWAASSRGIVLTSRANVTIKNCEIKDFVDGIYASGATRIYNIEVRNNTIWNMTASFFYSAVTGAPYATNITIVNNTMYNNSWGGSSAEGIYLNDRHENVTIADNKIFECKLRCIRVSDELIRYINISGNWVENSSVTNGGMIYFSSTAASYNRDNIIENNYITQGNNSRTTYAIYFDTREVSDNIIRNNTFFNLTSHVIYFIRSPNNTITLNNFTNSTPVNNAAYIYFNNASYNTVSFNNLSHDYGANNLFGSSTDGIRIYGAGTCNGSYTNLWNENGSNYNNITGNIIQNMTGFGVDIGLWTVLGGTGNRVENNTLFNINKSGMIFHSSNNTLIQNNTLYNTSLNDTSHGAQIYLYPGIGSGSGSKQSMGHLGENFVIKNNKITDTLNAGGLTITTMQNVLIEGNIFSRNPRGNTVSNSTNITFYNNDFDSEGIHTTYYSALVLSGNTTQSKIESNRIINSNWSGIRVYGVSHGNRFISNWLNNNGGKSYVGIFLGEASSANNSLLINNTVNGSAGNGILISVAFNTTLINNTFLNNAVVTTNAQDVNVANVGGDTFLVNNTFVTSYLDSPTYVNWFLGVHVNTSDTAHYANANVTFQNVSGVENFSLMTDKTGWIKIQNLTEMKNISAGSAIFNTNFTFNVTTNNVSYLNLTNQKLNLTRSTFLYITLDYGSLAPTTPSVSVLSLDGTNSTSSALNCTAIINDVNLDKMNVTVNWTRNNVLNLSLSYNNDSAGYQSGSVFSSILGSANLTIGDVWNCSIQLYDGSAYSSWGNSSNLLIRDGTKPSIYFVSPTPDNGARVSNDVFVNVTVEDSTNTSAFIDWNRSLVGYWSMDSYNSTAVGDNSSWKNHAAYAGSLSNSGITSGKYGNAIQLDGTTNYLDAGTGIMTDTGYHTITAWVKVNTAGAPGGDHYGILVGDNISSPFSGVSLYINKSNRAIGKYLDGWVYSTTYAVQEEEWNFVVIKGYKDASAGYLDVSLNGSAWDRIFTGDTSRLAVYSDNPFNIGRWGGNNYFTYGKIDEVKLYNRELSLEEIQAEYNNSVYRLNHSFTGLLPGTYNYTAYAIDEYGNLNSTEERNLSVFNDTTKPSINFVSPTPDNGNISNNNYAYLNVTIDDESNTSAFIDWNRTLLGYWSMDEYNSTYAHDNSSYERHANFSEYMTNNNFTQGMYGKAFSSKWYSSSGDGTYLDTGYWNVSSNQLTVMAWVYPNHNQGSTIIGQAYNSIHSYPYYVWNLYQTGSSLLFGINNSNVVGVSYLPSNQWTHVTGVYNSTHLIIYINGVMVKNVTSNTTGTVPGSTQKVFISSRDEILRNEAYNGSIDEVKVFSRVLSPEEINASYNQSFYRLYRNFTELSKVTYNYTAYSIDSNGNLNKTDSRNFTKDYTPYVSTINLYPTSPNDDQNLDCNFTIVDGDDLTTVVNVTWYNLSTIYLVQNISVQNNTLTNVTLQASSTIGGGIWNCTVQPYDGLIYGTANTSNTVTISSNDAPLIFSSRISPTSPYNTDNLLGYCNATDSNGDSVSYHYIWYKNNITNITGNISTYYNSQDDTEDEFSYSGTFGSPENAVDETWTTYTSIATALAPYEGNLYINYSIPDSVNNSKLEYQVRSSLCNEGEGGKIYCFNGTSNVEFVSWNENSGAIRTNATIPPSCTGDGLSRLQLTVYMICSNGAGYNRFTEEKVWWNIENKTYYTQALEINVNNLSNTLTSVGDNWTLECSAFDSFVNSSNKINSSVIIQNTVPNKVNLSAPAKGVSTYNRTINFEWDTGSDNDSQSLTYNLIVDDDINFGAPEVNQTGLSSINYTLISDLAVDKTYYWKVRANDGLDYGEYSDVWNITITSLLDIRAVNNTINFGTISSGVSDNTSDDSPLPFLIENNGNTLANISINSTELFTQAPLPSLNYRFKVDNNSNELGSIINWLTSIITWTNMPSAQVIAIDSLKYQNATDTAEVDILVTIPQDELAGSKNANITFKGSLAE